MSDAKGLDWYEESERDKMNMLDYCYRGNVEEVMKYANCKVLVNEADEDGVTALQIACARGHRNLAEYLLRQGADINLGNHCGMTPFLHACREGHVEVVKLLWNNRADVTLTTGLGVSALTLACAGQHFEVIKMLRYFELPINPTQTLIAPTPFMAACFNRDITILGFLSHNNSNAKHSKIDSLGLTAESFVIKCGFQYVLNSVQNSSTGNMKKKQDLRTAIENENEVTIRSLIENPSLAEPLTEGLTPLMYAAIMQKHSAAEQILSSQCRMIDSQENLIGMTALMFAIISGDNGMVQLLLNSNAKVGLSLTTELPFTAIDLLQSFSDFKHEILLSTYKRYLNIRLPSDIDDRFFGKKDNKMSSRLQLPTSKSSTISAPSTSSFPSTPIPTPKHSLNNLWRMVHNSFTEQRLQTTRKDGERFNALLPTAHIDWSEPLPFVLADEILRGDKKPTRIPKMGPDNYVTLARNILLHCLNHGDLLKPFPVGFPIDGKEDNFRESQLPPTLVLPGNVDEYGSTKHLCTAQRHDYEIGIKLIRDKNSVTSCPDYIDSSTNSTPFSTPLPKHRSIEWIEPPQNFKPPQKSFISQEKVRNAPSRPSSESQLTASQVTYSESIFNQQQQLQCYHQKFPSTTQSLGADLLETSKTPPSLNITNYLGSPNSTPGGSGNGTPILSRSERPFTLHQQIQENLPRNSWTMSSKSANNSPNAVSNVNPSESFRISKYAKRSSATNSPRINRPKLDTKQIIRQALINADVDKYYGYFSKEEIDEHQFLALKPNEVLEVLRRHLSVKENVEEIAKKISCTISQLSNIIRLAQYK